MSYSERYSETISGTEYYSRSYPASEEGGTIEGSVHWSEDVNIVITVDTSSFDHSVTTIKHHIDGLTGAVVATEVAQIEEKKRSANAIGQSVTTGFFRLISSEITQQMAGLKSRVDSLFLKLNEMKSACQRIQQTMQKDYHRITDRYTSIFEELDRELAMRTANLDEAAYTLKRDALAQIRRSYESTLSTVPTVFSRENSRAQGVLSVGTLRSKMNDLLQSAMAYLVSEKKTSKIISTMLIDDNRHIFGMSCLPVAFLAASDYPATSTERIVLPPTPVPLIDDQSLKGRILAQFREQNLGWKPLTREGRAQIERFLIPLVDSIQTSSKDHDARVRQSILQLWNSDTPETLPL